MTDTIRRTVMGSLLILLGLAFLLRNIGILHFEFQGLWPWLLIIPGIIFWGIFLFDRNHYRLILPGTILLTYGLLFLVVNTFQVGEMHYLWPIFVLGPGLGFLLMYFLGQRERAHLRTGSLLTLLAFAFFVLEANPDLFWPVLLIGVGLLMVVRGIQEGKKTPRKQGRIATPSTENPQNSSEQATEK